MGNRDQQEDLQNRRGFQDEGWQDDQGMLHWTQEEGSYSEKVSSDPHQEEGHGGRQPQVYRHHLQLRSRKVPDPRREGRLHGTPQEGQEGLNLFVVVIQMPPTTSTVVSILLHHPYHPEM